MGCGTSHKDGALIEALWPNFNREVNFWLPCVLLVPGGWGVILSCPRAEVWLGCTWSSEAATFHLSDCFYEMGEAAREQRKEMGVR